MADKARETLAALVEDRRAKAKWSNPRMDRHRRLLAHVFRDDGFWIQGEMLNRGMARIHTFINCREFARPMLALEQEARDERRGIWADSFYRVRSPVDAAASGFQLVQGQVVAAEWIKNQIYLNFGPDWRTDFTVRIAAKALPVFSEVGLDPLALKGQIVRVRGWIESLNGPTIDATHPEQIEIVGPEPPQARRPGGHSPCCNSKPR